MSPYWPTSSDSINKAGGNISKITRSNRLSGLRLSAKTQKWLGYASWLFFPLLLLIISLPHLNVYAGEYDEGPHLQAAALNGEGYSLYSEVTLNKPPLLVWWLRLAFKLGAVNLQTGRLAILFITTLGLLALGVLARLWWGQWAGRLTMGLFFLAPDMLQNIFLVTNILPAMSLMLLALILATQYRWHPRWGWAAATGGAFALAVGLHPLLIFMAIPVVLLLSFAKEDRLRPWPELVKTGLVAGGTAVLITLAWLAPLNSWSDFIFWVYDYNQASLGPVLQEQAALSGSTITHYFWENHRYLLIQSVIGILVLITRPRTRFASLIILVWLGLAIATLNTLQPLWDRYLLLLIYPLLLLSGGGLVLMGQAIFNRQPTHNKMGWQQPLAVGGLIIFVLMLLIGSPLTRDWKPWEKSYQAAQMFLTQRVKPGDFVLSDSQFLVFTSGALVPPSLADTSAKRISTQYLQVADVINAYLQYRPVYVVSENGRFSHMPDIFNWFEDVSTAQYDFGEVQIYKLPTIPEPQEMIGAAFEPGIELQGVATAVTHPNQKVLSLTLFWQAIYPLEDDYKIFVHLLDKDGQLISQYDGEPLQGWLPTSQWQPGILVADTFKLPIPTDAPSGTYYLVAGLYTWPDIQRLTVFDVDGQLLPDGSVPVMTITID